MPLENGKVLPPMFPVSSTVRSGMPVVALDELMRVVVSLRADGSVDEVVTEGKYDLICLFKLSPEGPLE